VAVLDSVIHSSLQISEARSQRPAFESMFSPRSVAAIGATDPEGSVAARCS